MQPIHLPYLRLTIGFPVKKMVNIKLSVHISPFPAGNSTFGANSSNLLNQHLSSPDYHPFCCKFI